MLVALVALILSQLPPLRDIAKGIDVAMNVDPVASLTTHSLGSPSLIAHVGLENVGGLPVTVYQIGCLLRSNKPLPKQWQMRAHSAARAGQNPFAQSSFLPLGWISIKPGDVWSGVVRCDHSPPETHFQAFLKLRDEFDKDIQGKLNRRIAPIPQPAQASTELTARASSLFREHFDLHSGSYDLVIQVALSDGRRLEVLRSLHLSDFDIRQLGQLKDDFRFGEGVVYPSAAGTQVRLSTVGQTASSISPSLSAPNTDLSPRN